MTDSQDSTLQMIMQMNGRLFARIHEGKLNYPKDVESLLLYVETAKKLNEPVVAGYILLTVGMAHLFIGKLEVAIDWCHQAHHLFQEANDQVHMAAAFNNIGEVYRIRGVYDKALELYREALDLSHSTPQDYTHPISRLTRNALIQMLTSNEGLTLLALEHYGEAEASFKQALDYFAGQTRANLDSICETRLGLAEVYLSQGQLKDAYSSIELAWESAESIQNNVILSQVYLTMAHILDADPDATESATDYYQKSRNLLEGTSLAVLIARSLMDEARYQNRQGNKTDTHRLAKEAHEMFVKFEMEEEAQLAQVLMGG